jgi:hypothetical protein
MTRTFSTITWGAALIVSAIVLNWQQSIPWAIASAGAVAVIVGVAKAIADEDAANKANVAKQRAQSKPSAFLDQDKGDAF